MFRRRILPLLLILMCTVSARAQFTDNFTDGNYTTAPTWSGDTFPYEVDASFRLHLNDTNAGVASLSTPSAAIHAASWEFKVDLGFNPSSTNLARVYLTSTNADLEASLNGYFVMVGNTLDEVALYRQTGTTITKIIDGVDGVLNTATVSTRVQVTRDAAGLWTLKRDITGGTTWFTEGTVTDVTHTTSSYFGVRSIYTITRRNLIWYDDFIVTGTAVPDLTPPTVTSISAISATQVEVQFSENVDVATATATTNYSATLGLGSPTSAMIDAGDSSLVTLTWSTPFVVCSTYTLTVSNVEDRAGNALSPAATGPFSYAVTPPAGYREVVINEIFADPDTAVTAMPNKEFLELHNPGSQPFNLDGWTIKDASTTVAVLPAHLLCPGEYVVVAGVGSSVLFAPFGATVIEVGLPSLNNAGDQLGLRDNFGNLVDTVDYVLSWYNDAVKDDGGWSLELINPFDTCDVAGNWTASIDVDGGTPGEVNSVFSLTPDITPPNLVSVTLIDSVTVEVCFDEAMDVISLSNTANYSITPAGLSISGIIVAPGNTCATLTLSPPVTLGVIYTLSMSNLTDCAGNMAPLMSDIFVKGSAPVVGDLVLNEIFSDPSPIVGLPESEFVELYNAGTNVLQLQGCTFTDRSASVATLGNQVLLPGEYLILCPTADVAEWTAFGKVLGVSSFPSLNNAGDSLELRNSGGTLLDKAYYLLSWYADAVKDDGGWTLERVNPTDTCKAATNWRASVDTLGGTPGEVNSIYDITPDVTAPFLSSVTLLDSVTLVVCFSEEMNIALLSNAGFYSVSGGLTVTAAVPSDDKLCVTLTLGSPAALGVVYTLTIVSMEDCAGNAAGTLTGTFVRGISPAPGQVIFNEIFCDPSPVVGLPETEFVELHNISTAVIQLSGCTFSDGGTPVTLPATVMMPGEYLILCSVSDAADWSPYGTVLGLASFPSLNNSGDSLQLRTSAGDLIDHAYYTSAWYNDATKDDGGWTIERINPTDTCKGKSNWSASLDADGGTPGVVNSVFSTTPDILPPSITSTVLLDSVTVQVCFDEEMDVALLADVANYAVTGGLTIVAAVPSPDKMCVTLTLSSPAALSVIYTLTLSDLTDCAGNWPGTLTTQFVKGGPANPADVIINEIFPDPAPTFGLPEVEFVEIHNRSASAIDITGWQLTDRTATIATFGPGTLLPGAYLILCPNADVGEYSTYGPTLGLSSFPSLNNASDSLELYDGDGTLIDFVYYSDDWYGDDTKKEGGWTLERKDASFVCQNPGNWAASTQPGGGTPGAVNSIAGSFIDSIAPSLEDALVIDPSILRIYFNESMDPSVLSDPANYNIDNGIGSPLVVAPDVTLTSVDLLLGTILDTNKVYCLTVSNVKDCPGISIAPPGNQICFGIPLPPAQGDLVLNEILFNPYTGGADYVEIYNMSDKLIDLREVYIAEMLEGTDSIINSDPVSEKFAILMPGEYLCVTEDKAFQLATYLPINPDAILEVADLPSFDDDEGECVIWTGSKLILDRFHYLDDYHFANLDDDNGVSLERLNFTLPTQDPMNWHSAASTVNYGTPGYENSQQIDPTTQNDNVSVNPKVFSPDSDGQDDVVTINYQFDEPGSNVRVNIFDRLGRHVRNLVPNTLVGTEPGTFTWDGTDDDLHKVPVGPYIILFEMINPNSGSTEEFKLTVIVAARF